MKETPPLEFCCLRDNKSGETGFLQAMSQPGHFEDFVIQIGASGAEELTLRVSQSPVGESEDVIAGAGSPLLSLLDRTRTDSGFVDRLLQESGPEALGRELFESLLYDAIERRFMEAVGRLASSDGSRAGLRLKLQVDLGSSLLAEVHALPWEYLYRSETGTFLGLDRRFTVVRHLRLPVARPEPEPSNVLRLLVAVASPRDRQLLETVEECKDIAGTWAAIDGVEPHFLEHATLEKVRNALVDDSYHGLHFIGHGQFDGPSGRGSLVLEDGNGGSSPCAARDLAIQLADRTSVRFVFLNACSTANTSARRPFAGLAAALLRTGVPAVLAMQRPVSDRGALAFSQVVYRRLAVGDSIDQAVSEGRLALHRLFPEDVEWGTPVLFLRSVGFELLAKAKAGESTLEPLSELQTAPSAETRRHWPAVLLLLVLGLVLWRAAQFGQVQEAAPGQLESTESRDNVASVAAPEVESVVVREGADVALPLVDARVSVAFVESHGMQIARLAVTTMADSKMHTKTVMGPATMDLGNGMALSIQSVDWSRRQVVVLPLAGL